MCHGATTHSAVAASDLSCTIIIEQRDCAIQYSPDGFS